MATGDLVVMGWQAEWSGLLFDGATDQSPYQLTAVEGLGDMPELRSADRSRLRRHGLIAGDDFVKGATSTWSIRIEGVDAASTYAAANALERATIPGRAEMPLVFWLPGIADDGKRRMGVRCRHRSIPKDNAYRVGIVEAQLQFDATDPRIYEDSMHVETASLPTAGGGLDVPTAVSWVIGTAVTGGSIFATNSGSFTTPLSARIDGPADNPRLIDVTNDRALQFNTSLAAGEFLTIDSDARTVLLNGSASRYYTIAAGSEWFDLDPGTTEITFRAATTTAAALTLQWRSAWV